MPSCVALVTVVTPLTVNIPPTLSRVIPLVVLFDEVMLSKVAPKVPVFKLSARPVPEIARSATVKVPKLLPEMPEPDTAELPMSKPRR